MRAAEAAGDPLGNCSLPWGRPSRPQTAQGPGTDPLPDASCSVSPQETPAGPAPVPPPQRSYPRVPAAAAVVLPGTCPDGNPKSGGGGESNAKGDGVKHKASWSFRNCASLPAESGKESALGLDHAGLRGGFQRHPTWKHTCQMNTSVYRVGGSLDPRESFSPCLPASARSLVRTGMRGKMDTKNGQFTVSPRPDLLLAGGLD